MQSLPMNPTKVIRSRTRRLVDLPNIGPASAADLRLLGIREPADLVGRDPWVMYEQLCEMTACRQDPCMLDVFISVTRFMSGQEPRPWWDFTEERKKTLAARRNSPAGTPEHSAHVSKDS